MRPLRFIAFFGLLLLLGSCSLVDDLSFDKRRYRPGWYIGSSGQGRSPDNPSSPSSGETAEKLRIFAEQPAAREKEECDGRERTHERLAKKIPVLARSLVGTSEKEKELTQRIAVSVKEQTQKLPSRKSQERQPTGGLNGEWILFGLLMALVTFLYTIQILNANPSMPIELALLLGMLLAGISLLTGQFFLV
ncbi:MAG: hypothetical protein AB1458_09635 [Bacteroidota bacterium]